MTAPTSRPVTIDALALPTGRSKVIEIDGYTVQTRDSGQVFGAAPPGPDEARKLGSEPPGEVRLDAGQTVAFGATIRFNQAGRVALPFITVIFRAGTRTYHQRDNVPVVLYGSKSNTVSVCKPADTPRVTDG